MITDAWNVKAEAEEEMKLQWLSEHGHVRNVWGKKERVTKNNRGKNSEIFLLEVMGPFILKMHKNNKPLQGMAPTECLLSACSLLSS